MEKLLSYKFRLELARPDVSDVRVRGEILRTGLPRFNPVMPRTDFHLPGDGLLSHFDSLQKRKNQTLLISTEATRAIAASIQKHSDYHIEDSSNFMARISIDIQSGFSFVGFLAQIAGNAIIRLSRNFSDTRDYKLDPSNDGENDTQLPEKDLMPSADIKIPKPDDTIAVATDWLMDCRIEFWKRGEDILELAKKGAAPEKIAAWVENERARLAKLVEKLQKGKERLLVKRKLTKELKIMFDALENSADKRIHELIDPLRILLKASPDYIYRQIFLVTSPNTPDLYQMSRQAADNFNFKAASKGVTINYNLAGGLRDRWALAPHVDVAAFRRSLDALVAKGVEDSEPGGTVRLELKTGGLSIAYKDNVTGSEVEKTINISKNDLIFADDIEFGFFRHPLTNQKIAFGKIDRKLIDRLVKEMRRYFKDRLNMMIERYRNGENGLTLSSEIENDKSVREIVEKTKSIIEWYAKKIGSDDFYSAMQHRYARPYRYYLNSELFFRIDTVNENLSLLSQPYLLPVYAVISETLRILALPAHNANLKIENHIRVTPFDNKPGINFELLEEVVEELIWNAMKYAATFVRIEWDEKCGAIKITNDGPGIPKGLDIFKKGVRGNHPQIEGTGLGLPQVLKAVEKEGWKLTYYSLPGETVFKLKIKGNEPKNP